MPAVRAGEGALVLRLVLVVELLEHPLAQLAGRGAGVERIHHPLGRLHVHAVELLGARFLPAADRASSRARVSGATRADHLGHLRGAPDPPRWDAGLVFRHPTPRVNGGPSLHWPTQWQTENAHPLKSRSARSAAPAPPSGCAARATCPAWSMAAATASRSR